MNDIRNIPEKYLAVVEQAMLNMALYKGLSEWNNNWYLSRAEDITFNYDEWMRYQMEESS